MRDESTYFLGEIQYQNPCNLLRGNILQERVLFKKGM